MGKWLFLGLAAAALITPVELTILGVLGTTPRWQARITLWGRALPVVDSTSLPQVLHRKRRAGQAARAKSFFQALRASVHTRGFWAKHIHLIRFDVLGRLALMDAAASALLCGSINSISALLPGTWRRNVRVRVLPDFSGGQTSFQYRGIVAFRLGTLLAGIVMLGAALLRVRYKSQAMKEAAA